LASSAAMATASRNNSGLRGSRAIRFLCRKIPSHNESGTFSRSQCLEDRPAARLAKFKPPMVANGTQAWIF
jgi:hypothetical protein